jgi:hypothetical protein
MRSGDVLRVGYTELTLDCAPDGPASRSRGVVTESDAAWILRRLAAFGGTIGAGALQALTLAGFALLRRWKMALVIGAIVLYVGAPNFRASTHNLAAWAFHRLLELVHQIVQ